MMPWRRSKKNKGSCRLCEAKEVDLDECEYCDDCLPIIEERVKNAAPTSSVNMNRSEQREAYEVPQICDTKRLNGQAFYR